MVNPMEKIITVIEDVVPDYVWPYILVPACIGAVCVFGFMIRSMIRDYTGKTK